MKCERGVAVTTRCAPLRGARKSAVLTATSLTLAIFFVALPAHAALVVSEIMYNPPGTNTGQQWIEVANTGPSTIDLGAKDIRLYDASGNHLIKAYTGASTELSAGSVAVIAKDPLTFLNNFANFSGTLLKSSFSLSSTAGIIGILQTDGGVLAQAKYNSSLGAAGDGNSLQRLVVLGGEINNGDSGAVSAIAGGNDAVSDEDAFTPVAPTPGILPTTLPAPLAAAVKLSTNNFGTNKGTSKRTSSKSTTSQRSSKTTHSSKKSLSTSHTTYGKGTLAPSAEADASADGALFPSIDFSFFAPLVPLFSSIWFACFLSLLAFSSFSLMLVQRRSLL